MLGLVEEGCVPVIFAEGDYNDRLEIIAGFPWAISVLTCERIVFYGDPFAACEREI
jgi:hypothetical protein